MKFFKAEDFEPILQVMHSLALDRTAELANAKLEREAKAVYGHYWGDLFMTIEQKDTLSTHTALVLNIQPIEKPKCVKHEPTVDFDSVLKYDLKPFVKCKNCGVEVTAKWVEKESE